MKQNVIPIQQKKHEHSIVTAHVKGLSQKTIIIDIDGVIINALKAFSCIVSPEIGDKVLVSNSGRECYILSILERPDQKNISCDFPGDVAFKTPKGNLDLIASKDINIGSAGKTNMFSSDLDITTGDTGIIANKVVSDINDVELRSGTVRFFTKSIDVVAERISQTTKSLMRKVEGVETLFAGSVIQNIKRIFSQHSHHAVITSKKDIKIDGERIHMG